MRMKRWLLIFWLAIAPGAHAAATEDATSARAMSNAGALELALARIDALQPNDPAAPRWAEWEALRCDVLVRMNRGEELAARVQKFSDAAPGTCLSDAARAALSQNDPQSARAHAARLLWQRAASPEEAKAVRVTVIESYIAERRGEDAFRSMLKFRQDYQPLDRVTAERFADALIDFDLDREALDWLRTDETSPARLRLQLRAGALEPSAVIAQARAAFQRNADPAYWRVAHEAAVRSRDASVQIEALERLLQMMDARRPDALADAARRLWQAYLTAAEDVGNREQLLMGEDGAWADYAARRLGSEPFLARAFYGFLAQRAQNPDIRNNAQLQLAYALSSSGLERAALRLMQRIGFDVDALDPQTRYLLGTIASKQNESAAALKLWDSMTPPANINAIEWQLTLARTALQAGDAQKSVETLKRLFAGRTTISSELAQSTLELAQEMLDLRKLDAAQAVYELVAPLSNDSRAREALFGLGRAHELKGEPVAAAAAYLRSALLVQATTPDALAFQARLLAALNLMRAGFKPDARAQFEWLLKNSKDAALTEAARRGLERL